MRPVHWRVRDIATEMGHVLYDHLMHEDDFYKEWIRQTPGLTAKEREAYFVHRNLSRLIPQARATLTTMMIETTDDALREDIYDALLLDATLVRGRAN